MKAKEFVLSKYPNASHYPMIGNGRDETTYVINKGRTLGNFPDEGAKTVSKAWTNARRAIEAEESQMTVKMRPIKFKAKKLEGDNGWVFGHFYQKSGRSMIIDDTGWKYRVIPHTVCQFTGLVDERGREIYENDLVRCFDDPVVVVYRYGSFYHKMQTDEAYGLLGELNRPYEQNNIAKYYEVTGNVFNT